MGGVGDVVKVGVSVLSSAFINSSHEIYVSILSQFTYVRTKMGSYIKYTYSGVTVYPGNNKLMPILS